jgi:tripartite-type tricarboxylate transporter receptor subunit TctC
MTSTARRDFLKTATAFAIGASPLLARAESATSAFKPTHPVRLISPLLAGGATDAIVRPIAQRLSEIWGQAVVVENHPGGGTVIGTQLVANAQPDGHTFGVAISALTINPSLRRDLPYDTFKDITPIAQIGNVTSALVAHPGFPAKNVRELIDIAKAKPGSISWASLGVGTGGHIIGELIGKRMGIEWVHVPFNGSSAAYRDILPGRIPVGFVVLESAMPHVKAGKLKLLAITDRERNKLVPDVPTISETLPGMGYDSVFGFIGPRGMPERIVSAMNADIVKVLGEADVRRRLDEQFMAVVASSPSQFAATIRREVEFWKQAVKESGAHVD